MKFRSPSARQIHLSDTSGHSAIVGPEWRELPPVLHPLAFAQGCQSDSAQFDNAPVVPAAGPDAINQTASHDDVIRKALETMLDRDEDGDFNADQLPNVKAVSKVAGLNCRKEDVLRVFRAMQAEASEDAAIEAAE